MFENTHTAHYWFLWNLQKLAPSTGLSRNHDTIYYHLVGLPHIKQFKCAVKKRPHFRNRHNCESCWTHGAMNSKTGFASYVPKCCSKPQFIMIHTLSVEVWWGEKKLFLFSGNWDWEGWRGLGFNLIYLQSGVVWKNAEIGPWLEVRSSPQCKPTTFFRGLMVYCIRASCSLCVCVCVCIFTPPPYQLIFPLCGEAWGAGSPRALGLC